MTVFVLVTGAIFRQPEERTSKAGKPFVMASIRVRDGSEFTFCRIFAFGETAQAELLRLGDGDSVSVQGALRVETYEKDGTTRPSFSVSANQVLALRQPPKQRKANESKPDLPVERRADNQTRSFDDSIPF